MCECYDRVKRLRERNSELVDRSVYWAYLHSNNNVQLKMWRPPTGDEDCDLCHARQEQIDGNVNIKEIIMYPFFAATMHLAMDEAREVFERAGYELDIEPEPDVDHSRFASLAREINE